MPKSNPPEWAPPRPGRYWSIEVLRQKVKDFDAVWVQKGWPGKPVWEFSVDRGLRDQENNPIGAQVLTDAEFFGDDAREPAPGRYRAECRIDGEAVSPPYEGIHFDKDARAEGHGRPESDGEALRRFTNDQFTRMEHEIARLTRQKEQYDNREEALQRKIETHLGALREKDAEKLAMERERDVAVLERAEAELRLEAALEEKRQLLEDNEAFREPARMLAAAIVTNTMERFGVMPPEGAGGAGEPPEPAAVRAAGNLIVMAVLRCPEAIEVLRLSVDEETGEPLLPIVQEPDVDPIDFLTSYLREVAEQAAQQEGYVNGAGPPEQPDQGAPS